MRTRQQSALAELGLLALRERSLNRLMEKAAKITASAMDCPYSKIFETLPGEAQALLVGACGVPAEHVGKATVDLHDNASQASFTWGNQDPVVVPDISTEDRFTFAHLPGEEDVRSGMSVVIEGSRAPWGLLSVHSTTADFFTLEDAGFLNSVANILAAAVERAHAEASANQQRQLLDAVEAAVIVVDTEGVVTHWNQFAEKMFGWSAEETIGKQLSTFGMAAAAPKMRDELRSALLRGETWSGEWSVICKDGNQLPVYSHNAPVRALDGTVTGIVGVSWDVSERIARQGALLRSESRFRAIFEATPLGVALVDAGGYIVASNPAYSSMLGYATGEVNGKHFLDLTHPEDVEVGIDQMRRLRAGEINHLSVEKRYVHRDGHTVHATIRSTRVADTPGEAPYLLGVIEDVTEKKSLEHEKHQLQQQLFQAQKMEAIGQLAGGVAHDFNNLLFVMQSNATFLREGLPDESPLLEDVDQILASCNRSQALVRQLLSFSRKEVVENVAFEIGGALEAMTGLLRSSLPEDMSLQVSAPSNSLWVQADPSQLEQVMLNLVINARDAMPHGGTITIAASTVKGGPGSLESVGTLLDAQLYVRLQVTDEGEGIPPEVLDHVFEPFFTTKPRGKGTGLGLATVYGIVKRSGGEITVSSSSSGTRFSIFLPLVEAVAPPEQEVLRPVDRWGSGETVLVAEDEPAVRSLVERILQNNNYQVLAFSSGAEALAAAERCETPLTLLLTDVVMPEMSGKELATKVRAVRPELKVLYMSGYTDDIVANHGLLGEDEELISKPFTGVDLLEKIKTLVGDVASAL